MFTFVNCDKRFYNKEYKKWLRVATVELNGYFKVSDFHSVLQTFFPTTSHILKRYTIQNRFPQKTT